MLWSMSRNDDETLRAARDAWHWRGLRRPPFALVPCPGQRSVWDFPRPPETVAEPREIVVRWGAQEVARTTGAVAVRETAHRRGVAVPDRERQVTGPLKPAPGLPATGLGDHGSTGPAAKHMKLSRVR